MKLAAMWAGGAVVSFSAFCVGMALAWPTHTPTPLSSRAPRLVPIVCPIRPGGPAADIARAFAGCFRGG